MLDNFSEERIKQLNLRFIEYIQVQEIKECWEWKGYQNRSGYGTFRVGEKKQYAHRFSWEIAFGKIPNGLCVLHHCDNPSCVNPSHLFLGTLADNVKDRENKGRGRFVYGKDHFNVKLTFKKVKEIKEKYIPRKYTMKMLADEYGVCPQTICNIVNGVSRKYG